MITSDQLANFVRAIRLGETSLEEFYSWFVDITMDTEEWPNESDKRLAERVDLLMSEYTGRHLDRDALLNELDELAKGKAGLPMRLDKEKYIFDKWRGVLERLGNE